MSMPDLVTTWRPPKPSAKNPGLRAVRALAQEFVERGRSDVFGDENRADATGLGCLDHLDQLRKIVFVVIVDGQRHELEVLGVGLIKEHQRVGKAEIAPLLTQCFLHVDDQKLKILNVPANRASQDRALVILKGRVTRHLASGPFCPVPWIPVWRETARTRDFFAGTQGTHARLMPYALVPLR